MIIEYCISCGKRLTRHNATYYSCPDGHDFYNNPSTATAVALVNEKHEILYAKRAHDPQKGLYDLPGGFVEFGEDPSAAIRRELIEEAGIHLGTIDFVTTVTNLYAENISTTDIIYVSRSWQGEPKPADDVEELVWKPIEFMDSNQYAWREMYKPVYTALREYLQHEPTSHSKN